MANTLTEEEINEDSPPEELHHCILEAIRTQRDEHQRASAMAKAELSRRDRQWQLKVAEDHAGAAKSAAGAAQQSAKAAVALVVVTVILAVIGLAPLIFT